VRQDDALDDTLIFKCLTGRRGNRQSALHVILNASFPRLLPKSGVMGIDKPSCVLYNVQALREIDISQEVVIGE
jgi:hypothetical protein